MYQRRILVEQTDPELWAAIQSENARQEHHIELIADVLDKPQDAANLDTVRAKVYALTSRFPL